MLLISVYYKIYYVHKRISCKNEKENNKVNKIDKANIWNIIAAIAAIIGVVVAIVIGIEAYNSRYDSSARAADAFRMDFCSTSNTAATTLTASAGSVWYGAWQASGSSDTTYAFYYKKTSSANYSNCIKTLTFNKNGTKGAKGDWRLARSRNSQKYDVKVRRTSNKKTKSKLRVDWSVDSYGSTGR